MKAKKIKYRKDNTKELFDGKYIIDNYISKEENIGYSVVRTHLKDGEHPLMKNINSNRTYYIIEGKANFVVEQENIEVETGDMIVIPKDTKYSFSGTFDAILIDSPAFDVKDDIIYN